MNWSPPMLDPKEAQQILKHYFDTVTKEQFEADLHAFCPELFDEGYFTLPYGQCPAHPVEVWQAELLAERARQMQQDVSAQE